MSDTEPDLRALLAEADHDWRVAEQTHGEWFGIQSAHFALGTMFNEEDARTCVAAVNALPALLDDRDRLRALEAGVEALRDEWHGWAATRTSPRIDAFRDAADRLDALLATRPDNEPT